MLIKCKPLTAIESLDATIQDFMRMRERQGWVLDVSERAPHGLSLLEPLGAPAVQVPWKSSDVLYLFYKV